MPGDPEMGKQKGLRNRDPRSEQRKIGAAMQVEKGLPDTPSYPWTWVGRG